MSVPKLKQIVILSGKGGTGKTTVAAALAHLASLEARPILVDADVDAANLELVLSPRVQESHEFYGGKTAVIDPDRCTGCGVCASVCRFDAVIVGERPYSVDPVACEGCASCFHRCPVNAVQMEEQLAGHWYRSETRFGLLLHARLLAGQENSGKLVTQIKQRARSLALAEKHDYLIIDGPPGIGCPVIAASAGTDLAVVVTEPTVAGVHDLERALATTRHFGVPTLVCLNKCDINAGRASQVERFCHEIGAPLIGRLPFDTVVTEAMVAGRTVTEHADGAISREMARIWMAIRDALPATAGSSVEIPAAIGRRNREDCGTSDVA